MKTITINTEAFSLTIYANVGLIGLHFCILIGGGLMFLFSQSDATRRLSLLFILLDIIVAVVLIFRGFVMSVDGESIKPAQPVKESKPKEEKKVVVKESEVESTSSKEIKNKVAAPAAEPEPEPEPEPTPAPEPETTPEPEPVVEEKSDDKALTDFTEDDWAGLLNSL